MANYREILNLVEEVRDILALERSGELTEAPKKMSKHNPFRWVKKGKPIGVGPRGRKNKKTGNWSCRCAVPYECMCKGPGGKRKVVTIDRAYKAKYNKIYRKWRKKHAKRYAPGKGSVFMPRPKMKKK